jgi:hypothetical protein
VARVAKAGQLAVLVEDISKALVGLGMPPIPRIPHVSGWASSFLEALGTILELLRKAYASWDGPWN